MYIGLIQSSNQVTITWTLVVSVLSSVCIFLGQHWYRSFIKRLDRMEIKINGIIRYLIQHSEPDERKGLSELIGEDDQ